MFVKVLCSISYICPYFWVRKYLAQHQWYRVRENLGQYTQMDDQSILCFLVGFSQSFSWSALSFQEELLWFHIWTIKTDLVTYLWMITLLVRRPSAYDSFCYVLLPPKNAPVDHRLWKSSIMMDWFPSCQRPGWTNDISGLVLCVLPFSCASRLHFMWHPGSQKATYLAFLLDYMLSVPEEHIIWSHFVIDPVYHEEFFWMYINHVFRFPYITFMSRAHLLWKHNFL
jgi:hypothetical protein